MGNKEQLLRGAKRSLVEHGWGRSTVRAIAEAADVSHAAIGYHFGSREALLTQALVESVNDLEEEIGRRTGADPEATWAALIDSFSSHRELWIAQLEATVQAQHSPDVRERLAAGQREARDGLGGSVPLALLTGLMLQWLVDPDHAPDADEVASGIRTLAQH